MNLILTSLLLYLIINQVYSYSPPIFVPTAECPNDFATICNLQCPNGNYVLDRKGCPTCACTSTEPIDRPSVPCPEIKCRANCGNAGYQTDENGCQTCKCASKDSVQCSRVMCRMYCENGFKRDENGCEYCACNESPQLCPQLFCQKTCTNGYRRDYSGCQTCDCACRALVCPTSLNKCAKGLKKDVDGCPTCSCNEQENRCPLETCRMFCTYGYRKNEVGCEVCECDWSPVVENIPCSERIPCPGTRVCNFDLGLCEIVDPDRVYWFVYDFEIETDLFDDPKFVETFKNGFINNVAGKYGLATSQIIVSAIEHNGMTSFQIMPFYAENMNIFDKKMDQIDIDLNSNEFRAVLPAVVRIAEGENIKYPNGIVTERRISKWNILKNPRYKIYVIGILIGWIVIFSAVGIIYIYRRRVRRATRSESKSPIYDTSYHQASTDEDHCHAVHAPDGTAYVVVESDDIQSSNDKRALV